MNQTMNPAMKPPPKPYVAYLRVLAGLFAGVMTWLMIVDLIHGDFGAVAVGLLLSAGLWYLALGRPIRDHFARIKAEEADLAVRAQAGHEAYLAGDPRAFAPPPPLPPKPKMRRGVLIAIVVAAVFVLIGAITDIADGLEKKADPKPTSQSAPASAAPANAAPAESEAAKLAPAAPSSAQAAPAESASASAAQSEAAPSGMAEQAAAVPAQPETAAAQVAMPQVVCMNLQDAQDTIQEAGVFYSRSKDASGKGRNQVLDRNWVVVAQDPPAGVMIGEGDAMLSVVKIGERGDCS